MKQLLLFFLLIYTSFYANAQIIWQNTIGGNSFDDVEDVIYTSDGGFLLVGVSESGISGDKSEANQGATDYWLVKTNNLGVVQWDKTFGGSGNDYPVTAIEALNGDFIIVGESDSNVSGDKSENSKGGYDFWIVRINSSGTKIWDKTFGGSDDEYAISVKETGTNDLIITGDSASNISGDKSENSRGFTDVWTIKVTDTGTFIWDKTFGGDADEEVINVLLTSDGGYLLGVIAESGISGDKTVNSSNNEDYWILKVSNTNTIDWQKSYGGTSNSVSILSSLITTSDGGYLLAGDSDSNIGSEKTENTNGGSDLWFIKTDNIGNIQWQNTIGGSDDEYVPYGFEKPGGGYIFAAETLSNISGDKTENSSSNDIWLVELDANGNIIADKTFGTNSTENPEQILQTNDGNYVVVSSIDELSGDNTEAPNGDTDYWLFKVNKSTLSTSKLNNDLELNIYPNPTINHLNIASKNKINTIEIIDLTGKLISKIKSPNKVIDISKLPIGVYIIKSYSKNGVTNKRVIKI
ncbi:T9SS C-terminal target domain-containing protein [Algibacter marinivivus]|uniref:T9SS C-terminal target domain-containing protein n=1 Tax=Algibacter marinivivus TaxID=2100723 RepID=A0A2U2X5I6_9FLAO|nr:T9SS type A sorting domain-containing protein [Algibacter marinivivus]PWH83055.1 T9SS C-terminal target domain-containing protein [Algibacter marinivivus]